MTKKLFRFLLPLLLALVLCLPLSLPVSTTPAVESAAQNQDGNMPTGDGGYPARPGRDETPQDGYDTFYASYEYYDVSAFWVFYVLNGFLLPIAPLVVGVVTAHSAKRGKPRRWYILSALAGAWMLLATVLALFLAL